MSGTVAFCISGHGFGHASRQVEVINALGHLRPDVAIVLYTVASRWLLDRTITVPVRVEAMACDTGAVQKDSLELDVPATLAAAQAFEEAADGHADTLARAFTAADTRLVVCDAPAMPFTAARLAGIPAVAVTNFTWDWIYDDFTSDHPGYEDLTGRLQARYAQASAAWRLPMHGGFQSFSTVLDMPWVARRSTRDPADTRRTLGIDDARPLALLSFGGYGVAEWDLSRHAGAPYRLVVSGGASNDPEQLPADAIAIARDDLQARGLRYEDLVAACDLVVSKPGYGIVSECVANRTALLYTDRGRFREYPVMVASMPQVLRAHFISRDRLAQARWDAEIEALLAQPEPPDRPLVNGADVAAGMISTFFCR